MKLVPSSLNQKPLLIFSMMALSLLSLNFSAHGKSNVDVKEVVRVLTKAKYAVHCEEQKNGKTENINSAIELVVDGINDETKTVVVSSFASTSKSLNSETCILFNLR